MGIRDRPIALRSPWQNAYVERLIGSIRRECLDHMIVFGKAHLRRMVGAYAAYYNKSRTHRSLNKAPRFIVRFSVSAPSNHSLSSAAFTTNIAESNFRYTQVHTLARGHFALRDGALDDAAVGSGRYVARRLSART
jgi:hypothetical protein